ncbi:MAG: endonuclease Q family protein [Candidatus Aenigmatarchaeota archaeon]
MKGLHVLGTGDFTHPRWLDELKRMLKPSPGEDGLYAYGGVRWVLQAEISLIYTQDGRQRRVHHVILAPNFEVADQINEWLDTKGRRDYDGRPTFGFSSIELVESMMGISRDIAIIPAHAWTPWYAIFGSKSGFDSIEECFGDQAKHIFAVETGMSSTPAMNWRLSKLDRISLVSNSDSHSPVSWRLGREANAFDLKKSSYRAIIDAIRTRKGFAFTIETPAEYGKYHWDGHRFCSFSCSPAETRRLGGRCPRCGRELTIGVEYRVEQLADRPEGFVPEGAVPFKPLIPLAELVALAKNSGIATQRVRETYDALIARFGSELAVLLDAPQSELLSIVNEKIADLILRNRAGRIKIQPGYDGVYGKPVLGGGSSSSLEDFVKSQTVRA